MHRIVSALAWLAGMAVTPAIAETFYVVPPATQISEQSDGSDAKPFRSVIDAFKSGKVKGGDTLLLKDGGYGNLVIKANAAFDQPVTIKSQNARRAQFDSILLMSSTRYITLQNLSVWPSNPSAGEPFLIRSYSTTSDITVDSLVIRSDSTSSRFMDWDAEMWEERKFSGIMLDGPRSVVSRNRLIGINHGIMTLGPNSKIIRNIVNGFNGDGIRAFDESTIKYNRVLNCVKTNDNHDDGIQSFAGASGSLSGLRIDGNVIVEWTGSPNHPLRCDLQGIGLFDGFYDNLVVSNNLVSVSQYHGISVYGARNARVINNTVVNNRGQTSIYPWLRVENHKNGTPSVNTVVANNVAMSLYGQTTTGSGVKFTRNSIVGTPGAVFVNPSAFDYRPKASSGFIDSADGAFTPPYDMLNQRRPSGAAPDRGSYETMVSGDSASMMAALSEAEGEEAEPPAGTEPTTTTSTAKWIKLPGN
jgi:parallel beta-helix repeat protein